MLHVDRPSVSLRPVSRRRLELTPELEADPQWLQLAALAIRTVTLCVTVIAIAYVAMMVVR